MRIYYWPTVIALSGWLPGQVIAVADSLDEAIAAALEAERGNVSSQADLDGTSSEGSRQYNEDHLRTLEMDLRRVAPIVATGPWALCIQGRD